MQALSHTYLTFSWANINDFFLVDVHYKSIELEWVHLN